MAEQPVRVARKTYQPPKLTRYGSLRDLTREISCNTNKDGGSNAVCRRT
ncbi:MAG TPA: lasso RiPP family leader peptide-containing protein [Thermoanaerobaculia bacterium]|nr:lasso RiPP family leader peptide-containing protein [Thermoanaerobaculia bacterium]